jgi:transcriptional regulator
MNRQRTIQAQQADDTRQVERHVADLSLEQMAALLAEQAETVRVMETTKANASAILRKLEQLDQTANDLRARYALHAGD